MQSDSSVFRHDQIDVEGANLEDRATRVVGIRPFEVDAKRFGKLIRLTIDGLHLRLLQPTHALGVFVEVLDDVPGIFSTWECAVEV
ncbi:hypothetical protein, partial [Streptacidiphilus carbonis]|uniref:hypothetical protein n=1 Tax=Streptacidiphilus carbonis TaxID=105422 RepID=UPI00126991FC